MSVYLVRAGEHGPVKIGYAENVARRMIKMQADNHVRLILLRELTGGKAEEAVLHLRFADLRLHGEWFGFSRLMMGDVGMADARVFEPGPKTPAVDTKAAIAREAIEARVVAADFGQRLATARKAARLTQHKLAERVGMDRTNIVKYERGEYHPSISRLASLAAAVGVTVQWLLGAEAA